MQCGLFPNYSTLESAATLVHASARPMVWNSLPDDLRAQQDYESLRKGPENLAFLQILAVQRIRDFCDNSAI